mgnify:CR=1 FL=1
MKKLIAIIIILAIIFVGMVVYKNVAINTSNNISIQEISQIETYITKIYMWKEITGQALPNFEDINQAEDVWIWEVVKKNLEDYEFFYEEIQEKAKDLFGERLTKEFPKEGTEYIIYDEKIDKYYAVGMGLDQLDDLFLLNEIQKTPTGYEVEIIEYLEDYSQTLNEEDDFVIIRNTNEEEIGRVNSKEEEKVKEMVKNHIDKLSKKKIVLKLENEKLYVESVK